MQPPLWLRYRRTMTKSPRKIVLRKETLRVLAASNLAHAVGGGASPELVYLGEVESQAKNCVAVAAVPG